MSLPLASGPNPDVPASVYRSERGACAKCALYENCLFHLTRMGGFKGQGRHNIGVRIITDKVEGHNGKEDICSCVTFVEGSYQDRMLSGNEFRMRGKDGERISVIAQEGETIDQRFDVGFNAKNEVVRPMRHIIEPLKKAGYKVNLDDMNSAQEFKPVTLKMVVPKYETPNLQRSDYAAEILRRAEQEEQSQEDAETAAWKEVRAKQAAQDAPKPKESESSVDFDMTVAEPRKKP